MPDEHSSRAHRRTSRSAAGPFPHLDLDGLGIEEREQAEFERDRLVELAARMEMRRADSPFYEDDRFSAWLGREMRARRATGGRREAVENHEMARLLWERIAVRWIARAGPSPVARPALVDSPMLVAVEEAQRHGCAPQWDLAVAAGAGRALWEEPCECWVTLPPGTPPGRYVALRVAGDSMAPAIHSGDVIVVRLGGELVRGSFVVARSSEDGYVVKRVGRAERERVELESINPDYASIPIPRESSRVLGTVIMRWCDHCTPTAESLERHS
ncbi:MAG TPA: S24 family peptidase [Gemmatimonadaceae bacterium]|nr:S24 family peptidase [Gemmatimonadaceae bacterium]